MTSESREPCDIEIGIKRGISDVEAGRCNDFTPSYAKGLAAKFKGRLKTEQRFKNGLWFIV